MRTKTLILAAAALAAGLATSMAQTVYSVNVVGYANMTPATISLTNGYNMLANQFDFDLTGTNNSVVTVFGNQLPNGTKVVAFGGGTFPSALFATTGGGKWSGNTNTINAALQPGGAVFVVIPGTAPYPQTITVLGNVLQKTNTFPLVAGYNSVSYMVPVTGGVSSVLGYKATVGDKLLRWNAPARTYFAQKLYGATGWGGGEPVININEGFMLNCKVATNWTQAFTVQ